MKKALWLFMALVVLILAGIQVFIPAEIRVGYGITFPAAQPAVYRMIVDSSQWQQWWPWENKGERPFKMVNYRLQWATPTPTAAVIDLQGTDDTIISVLESYFINYDSAGLEWSCRVPSGNNPVSKVLAFSKARRLADQMTSLVNSMSLFFSDPEKVYGSAPVHSRVTDTVLMATRAELNHYPSTEEIYLLIDKVRAHIAGQGGLETNPPMLHVNQEDDSTFKVMVGIPTNKVLPASKDIELKRLVRGNLLVAEVKAGPVSLPQLFRNFEEYRNDYRLTSPAIPYQVLLTDRRATADTTKWLTRFCYPIF